jgi:para-aminobenzoate synthetase component 1
VIIRVSNVQLFKQRALKWANGFDTVCYLDSNNFTDQYSKFDTLIATGAKSHITSKAGTAFEDLSRFKEQNPGFVIGFLGYDLKNELEDLTSNNTDGTGFPDLYFFSPQTTITIKGNEIEIVGDIDTVAKLVEPEALEPLSDSASFNINLTARFNRQEYINTVNTIKQHIIRGDIYVTNFCQEFYAEDVNIEPLALFNKLNSVSPTPFTTYFKWKGNYIICASHIPTYKGYCKAR